MKNEALLYQLRELRIYLEEPGVNEVIINKPGEIFVEKSGVIEHYELPTLTEENLLAIARLIARSTNQKIDRANPLLSAALPTGERVQIVLPPACKEDQIGFAIRKQAVTDLTLDDIKEMLKPRPFMIDDNTLSKLFKESNPIEFLTKAVEAKQNIMISGGTGTGKTTFMNVLCKSIPNNERVITIEDVLEVVLTQKNNIRLLASKGGQGEAKVTHIQLLESCLRLRPDRILLSEVRGKEAFNYLESINTGHPGSISTVHANNIEGAIERLVMMSLRGSQGYTKEQLKDYIKNSINVFVQIYRSNTGSRHITEIYYNGKFKTIS